MKKVFLLLLMCSAVALTANADKLAFGTWTPVSGGQNGNSVTCVGQGYCYKLIGNKVYRFGENGELIYVGIKLEVYDAGTGNTVEDANIPNEFDGSDYILEYDD